jgi:hypothetical protein
MTRIKVLFIILIGERMFCIQEILNLRQMFAAFFLVNNIPNQCSQNTPFVSKLITKYSLYRLCSTVSYVLFIATCLGFFLRPSSGG